MTARERRETLLIEQLEERDQLLREKQQQLTQKEEREETFQTHLREMEQRLRDIETSETRQREQFRVKHLRVQDRQKQLKEYRERDRYYQLLTITITILLLTDRHLIQREMDIASRCHHRCLLRFIGAIDDEETPLVLTKLMKTSLRQLYGERCLLLKIPLFVWI